MMKQNTGNSIVDVCKKVVKMMVEFKLAKKKKMKQAWDTEKMIGS